MPESHANTGPNPVTSDASGVRPARLAWAVFFVAAGVLGFEISLMRLLLAASWHHFAFLVISVVLLGFGASGTALSILPRSWIMPRAGGVLLGLVLAAAASIPICTGLAQHIPLEARFVPSLMWRQIGCWIAYWALLGIPFFLGAGAIGLSLMAAGRDVPGIYAANLLGSAAGSILASAAMTLVPPAWLAPLTAGLVLIGAAGLNAGSAITRRLGWIACVTITLTYLAVDPPRVRLDPYKYGAYVERLERQELASSVAVEYGSRAVVQAYRGDVFHDIPFLSGGATPPSITILVADGHYAGSVLDVGSPPEAAVVDQTVMAFPYALTPPGSRVLLLGEAGGSNVWLAERHDAASIRVVQPDANIVALLRGPLRERGGGVFDLPGVVVEAAQPRHFVEHTRERFDLVQLVTLESSAAGSGGTGGMGQDHLITVEGITACLDRLTGEGILTATRGIQTPPRDNLKLLATFVAALDKNHVRTPEDHIVIVRDFLAVCTMVKASPWTAHQVRRIRSVCADRSLTPVWFPGIRSDELNQPDALPGPPGAPGDWYHHAATRLFSPSAREFIDDWPFDIRPPTDDRPFFLDFCKLASIGELKRTFGDLWLTRTELAFLFVLAAIVVVGVGAVALTLLPLLLHRERRRGGGLGAAVGYFGAIGLGYLLLEMTFLSRLQHWIGDPVSAAAVTITAFLFFSGLGSLTAQRTVRNPTRLIRGVIALLLVVGVLEVVFVGRLSGTVGSLPYLVRCAASLVVVAPLGYLMGFPMPMALARLDQSAAPLIPWAWGINGFASVLAAPLATAVGMSWGFRTVGVLALILYVIPAMLFVKLPAPVGGRQ